MNTPSEQLTVSCQMREDYNDVLKKGDIVWTTRDGYYDFFVYYADDITPSLYDRMLSELITSNLPNVNDKLEKEFEKELNQEESDQEESDQEESDDICKPNKSVSTNKPAEPKDKPAENIKPRLEIVICQLDKTLDKGHRKGDIVYTDPVSYQTYFKDRATLIPTIDEMFSKKDRHAMAHIILKDVFKPDVEKEVPDYYTEEDFLRQVAQRIWNRPDNKLDAFTYAIY